MASGKSSSDVRVRILETAWRLIAARGDASVNLLDIAREAGVSRQTLYVQFGSRAGLLLAMVEHRDSTAPELARVKRSRIALPVEEMLEATVRAWFKYVPVVYPVAHALQAAAVTDPDAREAWDSRMAALHAGLLAMMQRLKKEGRLAPGWTPATAADWCHHLVHIDTWHHLVVERKWRPNEMVQRTLAALRATLVIRSENAA